LLSLFVEKSFQKEQAESYLELVKDWVDPNPPPVLRMHDDILVVRDDLLEVGTKARAADYLIRNNEHIEEWVYGSSPATGYAQISLPYVCGLYNKRAVIFMAERALDKLHPYQKKAIKLGADFRWVPNGMLNVTEKRAKDYVAERPETRCLLPIGLEHPTVFGSLIKVARSLGVQPDQVWSVGSSGTLTRSLQMAFPNAEVHVVSVGHTMSEHEIGRAIYHKSKYNFKQSVKKEEAPPFNSCSTYDAKAWQPMLDWHSKMGRPKTVLFWNVAGEVK